MPVYLERARLRAELLRELAGYPSNPEAAEGIARAVARAMDRHEPALAAAAHLPPVTDGARPEFYTVAEYALERFAERSSNSLGRLSSAVEQRLPMVRGDRFRGYLHRAAAMELAADAAATNASYVFPPPARLIIVGDNIVHGMFSTLFRHGAHLSGGETRDRLMQQHLRAIALHEAVHRVQDRAVPWIGTSYAEVLADDDGPVTAEHVPPLGREYRDAHDYLDALACLVEGHAEWTAKQVAATSFPDTLGSFYTDVTGLDPVTGTQRHSQYACGLGFVEGVVAQVGVSGFNEVWRGPHNVPSMLEIHQPSRWVNRMRLGPGR